METTISPVRFARPEIVRYDSDCYTIHDRDVFIYSAAFHYFRCPQPLWRDRLIKHRQAGYNCIDIYIPWNWHERVEGKMDLSELVAVLELAQELGLYVIARPGPYICSEWDAGGFPRWLAIKGIGYRSDSEESIRWSRHWFDAVLPVLREHSITRGGPVIMVQLENEYDYSGKPDSEMTAYIKALYKMALDNGIDVPLMTCWTRVARANDDPDMLQIMDSCNFYTWWDNIDPYVVPELQKLAREEPYSPEMVTELQGGWFNNFGQPATPHDLGANQINVLTKTCLEHGVTVANHYMAFGGTNFGWWPARNVTTTYDYHAPQREQGGLWQKWYAAKLIGDMCDSLGGILARSEITEGAASTQEENVRVLQRNGGEAAFVFARNYSNEHKWAHVHATNPETGKTTTVGVHLPPLDMKILPVNVPVSEDSRILVANAEVQSITRMGNRTVVVLYRDKYLPAETLDVDIETGGRRSTHKMPLIDTDSAKQVGDLVIVSTVRARAERTWRALGGVAVTDAYLVNPTGPDSAHFYTRPGKCAVSLFVEREPRAISIQDQDIAFRYDSRTLRASFSLSTAPFVEKGVEIKRARVAYEKFAAGKWREMSLESLDELGIFENGYTRYRSSFEVDHSGILMLGGYAPDPAVVFVNGKLVSAGSSVGSVLYIKPGANTVEVLYENPGRPNGGPGMEELKGISSAVFAQKKSVKRVSFSKFRFSKDTWANEHSPQSKPGFDDSALPEIEAGAGYQAEMLNYTGWAWYRARFDVPEKAQAAMLVCEGIADNYYVFLNGHKIGENFGWSTPATFDAASALVSGENVLTIAVQSNGGEGGIFKPVYLLHSRDTQRIDNWQICKDLAGENAGWQDVGFDASDWDTVQLRALAPVRPSTGISPDEAVVWYRMEFALPCHDGWQAPWKLELDASGEALIYLNEILVGRYSDRGPQTAFYLPECWLNFGEDINTLALAIRAGINRPMLRKATVLPYSEYVAKINEVKIRF